MKAGQVQRRRRDESRQSGNEIQRLGDHVRGAVAVRGFQRIADVAARGEEQALFRDRRTAGVAPAAGLAQCRQQSLDCPGQTYDLDAGGTRVIQVTEVAAVAGDEHICALRDRRCQDRDVLVGQSMLARRCKVRRQWFLAD